MADELTLKEIRWTGAAAATRSSAFGPLWSDDPTRAAYEAALSATVTHGHPAAIAGAAAWIGCRPFITRLGVLEP